MNMTALSNPREATRELKRVRQARLYEPRAIPNDVLQELLQIARWTGSSRNTQPWEFIIVDDREQLRKISQIRTPINWVADVPVAIAIVLEGGSLASEAYDEGRVTERLLIGARLLGLGGGIAWFGDDAQQAEGKRILGIPENRTARSVVALGYPTTTKDHRPNPAVAGRKPLTELVSHNRYGQRSL
jgi:nitroreductase